MKKKKLYAPVKTRFGSKVMYLRRLYDYKAVVNDCYGSKTHLKSRVPSDMEWSVVEEVLEITEPIFKICILNQSKECWFASDAIRYKLLTIFSQFFVIYIFLPLVFGHVQICSKSAEHSGGKDGEV
jgi:hypothetical protein